MVIKWLRQKRGIYMGILNKRNKTLVENLNHKKCIYINIKNMQFKKNDN